MDSQGYLALCYSLSIVCISILACYAFWRGYTFRKRINNTESFITARGQVGAMRIAWSFYAGAVGAWVIASPASYAATAGMLGLVFYALSSGLPFIMIAFAGEKIRRKIPHVLSLTDFIRWRFGIAAKTYVVLLILFNMSIALLAEYTTIGTIFQAYVGSVPYPIVLVVGFLTMAYTAYGGLLVSIYTDRIQGIVSVIFFGVLAIYMAATFRPASLPKPMPCSPTDAFCISGTPNCGQFNSYNQDHPDAPVPCPTSGYSAIFVMPVSLFTATVFSEALWQRVWASESKRALQVGAMVGAVFVVLIVFFAGLCGLLAAWAGLITMDTNYNLYLFQVLHRGQIPAIPTVSNWIGVVCVVLACIMNEGAVDSIQNGMAAAITSYLVHFYKSWTLLKTRMVTLVLNCGLIGIAVWLTLGTVKVSVLELFLMANMLACSSAVPVLVGLSERLYKYYDGASFLFSCLFSIFCTCVFGVNYYYQNFPDGFTDPYNPDRIYYAGSFNSAMFYTWIGNGYAWQFFLIPVCVSIGCILLCAALSYIHQRFVKRVPRFAWTGFVAPATHPELYPVDETKEELPSAEGSTEKKEEYEAVPFSNMAVTDVKVSHEQK